MKYIHRFIFSSYSILIASVLLFPRNSCGQLLQEKQKFSRQDSLRGSLNSKRDWWNVVHYNLFVTPDIKEKTIRGWNQIGFDVISGGSK
ncbi:MAG TPA: hypothetical protein PLZ10_14385, partial [Chitinophagaceae bacterium]|nr:hypothetical protein [Chitinophagaceae bacterium]